MGERAIDWDVDYWANRYPIGYLAIYNREIQKSPMSSLRGLWRWKTLHRTKLDADELQPYMKSAIELCRDVDGDVSEVTPEDVTDTFLELRSQMKTEDGPLSVNSRVVVTPQFLLHLADSRNEYSGRFPILDVMVARAIRIHTATDDSVTIQGMLTAGRKSYRALVKYIFDRCETASEVANLERALFVQGRAIARYRENEGDFDEIRKVPVSVAREYLDDIERHTNN